MPTTGLRNVDRSFGGAREGELTVVLASADHSPFPILACIASNAPGPTIVFTNTLDRWQTVAQDSGRIRVIELAGRDLDAVMGDLEAAHAFDNPQCVIIDDLQSVRSFRYQRENCPRRLAFQALASKLGIALVVGWTSPREGEAPRYSDLRATVADEPDLLIFAWKDRDAPHAYRVAAHRQDGTGVTFEDVVPAGAA